MWKPSKEASFKSKILTWYGNNPNKYNFLIKCRDKWVSNAAYVSEELVQEFAEDMRKLVPISSDQLNLSDLKLEPLTEEYIKEKFNKDIDLTVVRNSARTDTPLTTGSPAALKSSTKRNAFAVATGGQILSIQWLPREGESEVSYFAVSISNNPEGPGALNPEFSMFNKSKNPACSSAIQLWKYDFEKNEVSLENVLVTSDLGLGYSLKWAPIYTNGGGVLGVLMGVFTDGNVHVLKITESLPRYSKITQSSLLYSGKDGTKITAFDFIGAEKILVGTTDGAISEYMLPFDYEGGDLDVPNFKEIVCWGAIQHLLCTDDESGNRLCIVYTAAHRCLSFVYDNSLQDVYAVVPRSHIQPCYNYVMQNLIIINLPDQSLMSSPRTNHYTGSAVAKTDFYYTACKVSEVLGHPFFLSGGANGDITVQNYMKKFMTSKAGATKAMPFRLWKFSAKPDGKFALISDIHVEPQEAPVPPAATRIGGVVTAVAWNENIIGSSTFAAGIAGGVLLIERLDPTYL
ncbi:Transcription factor tau subunit [Candida viswanathii]|uniref:Transcription factor tau subunit n=1 Tax=Candida viswanathii TaxID=5486 RepID=A0A367YE93_9ASCO|nr:Transcription factor tau subunit [Candida viswanathii]